MAEGRRTKLREAAQERANIKLDVAREALGTPDHPLTPEQRYLQRKDEVARQDNAQFADYLAEKGAREQRQKPAARQWAPSKLNRRNILTWAAGTAAVGEAVVLGYPMVTGQNISDRGLRSGAAVSTEPQRHPIDRELINPQADIGGRKFGNWVLLMPTKLGGGTYAVNLNTGRTLAWISYWNYGDYNP